MQISCATPVTDGMVVNTQSPQREGVQDGVLEFLLINHPLDCPVCDRGGECPLQDQTLAFGPGESRFVEEKRHFEKPIPISDLVLLDRERCIQCGRCTRFAAEIAGDPLIDFGGRGGTPRSSPTPTSRSRRTSRATRCRSARSARSPRRRTASGPGRGTSRRSRRRAQTCAVGCRGALQSTSNRIVRLLGVDSEPVNQGWLCDKGRYGYEWVHSDGARARADGAQGRRAGRGVVARGARRRGRRAARGARRPRARRRSRCSAARAARTRTRTCGPASPRACSAPTTSTPSSATACPPTSCSACPRATIADLDRGPRPSCWSRPTSSEELPVLYLRVRRAAVELGVPLIEHRAARQRAHARRHRGAARTRPARPGAMADAVRRARSPATAPRRATARSRRPCARSTVATATSWWCSAGSRSPSRPTSVVQAAAALAALPGREVPRPRCGAATCAARSTSGSRPGFLPGPGHPRRRPRAVHRRVGRGPDASAGSTPPAILEAAAAGTIDTLRAARRRPERGLPRPHPHAAPGSTRCGSSIAVGAFTHRRRRPRRRVPARPRCGVRRTAAPPTSRAGCMRLARLITPEGTTMDDWRIAAGARAALRRRLRPRDRRRRPGRDRAGRAGPRRRRRRAHPPGARRRGAADRRLPRRDRAPARARRHHRRVVGADQARRSPPTRRTCRRSGTGAVEASGTGADATDQARARDRDRPRGRSGGRGRGRDRDRGARGAARAARVGPRGVGPGAGAARRVQSPPRGRPHALRRRTHRVGEPVAGRARVRGRARGPPQRPRPHRRERRRRRSAASPAAAAPSRAGARRRRHRARHRVHGVRAARRGRAQRPGRHHRRRSPSCGWRPRGEPDCSASPTRCSQTALDITVVLIVIGKTIVVFALLLVSVLLYIWFLRKVIAEMQNRIGPDRAGPVRAAPDPRRRHQAVLQGAVGAQHRRPPHLPHRAVPLGAARVPRVQHRAHRRRGHDRRAPDLPPARRPPVRGPVAAGDVGPRALRRAARRVVVAARSTRCSARCARRRSCSATKPRSGSRSSACSCRRTRCRPGAS